MQQHYSSVRSTDVHGCRNKLGVCLTDFSPSDTAWLRRPKNGKFGRPTNVASSTRMMRALRFLEKVFNCGKICKKREKERGRKREKRAHSSPRTTAGTTNRPSRNAEICTNVAHMAWGWCPNFLFSDKLCTALKIMHYELCFALITHNTKVPAEAAALQALEHSGGAVGRMGRAIYSNMTSLTYVGRS